MADCKISVVIPVYNVEKYVRKCLDSVIGQTFSDYEVIIVNDGSKDSSPQILKEYKALYPELIIVYDTENKGVSHARNFGVSKARGQYVLFVDSDDFIEADMCEKLYQKAEEDASDIVICDRYDFFENETDGNVKRKKSNGFYMPFARNIDLKKQKYELIHISPFPWDKLYHIDLIKKFPFPEGSRFEDLAVMYQICLSGSKISVIGDYLYNYRRTASGGFLNTFSKETKDIVKACKKIVEDFKKNGWYDEYYNELEYICTRHLLLRYNVLFDKEQKGKLKLKKELIHETQDFLDEHFSDWRKNHYLRYSVSGEMKQKFERYKNRKRLLRQAVYREYIPVRLQKALSLCKTKIKGLGSQLKAFLKNKNKKETLKKKVKFLKKLEETPSMQYTRYYETLPVDPSLVLFESKHGDDVAGNIFRLMLSMSGEKYQKFKVLLVLKKAGRESYGKLLKHYGMDYVRVIGMGSSEYLKSLANAKYLITDTSFPSYYIKRPDQVYLNTWHGTPLKAMGRIVPRREYALGNVQRNFYVADYLLYQNEFSRDVFLKDYMIDKLYEGRILLSGYPRNSAFFDEEARSKVRREVLFGKFDNQTNFVPIPKELGEEKQLIAYMPTWRGLLDKKESKKQIKIITGYLKQIDEKLADHQVFYVKLHPFVKEGIKYEGYAHIKPFPEEYETYDFLNATDVLVTDYSSIMFDYAASGRSIVLFTYDREEYLKDRGMYLNLEEMEFSKADTVDDLIEAIKEPADYRQFQREYCSHDGREAAELVARQLFFGENEGKFPVETIKKSNKERVLIFLGGLGKGEKTKRLIENLNGLDTERYDYYLCMNADSVKAATFMISKIKKEIGYFPITFSLNVTKKEKIKLAAFLRYGIKGFGINQTIAKIAERERRKHFGVLTFGYVINYSVKDKMLSRVCESFPAKKRINLSGEAEDKFEKLTKFLEGLQAAGRDGY